MQLLKIKKKLFMFEWWKRRVIYSRDFPTETRRAWERTKRLSIAQLLKSYKINFPSYWRKFFNKLLFKKRRYFWCDIWCSSGNRSWCTKSNYKGNTNKVQKHYSRKHHALLKFACSLPQKIESSKKRFGDQASDI